MEERESAMRSCTELMHSRNSRIKNWRCGLLFSGTHVPSIHYLVQFNKAIVVVISILQPISSILCAM